MSTCVKIIFHEENDGVDVRVGYDKTPDATKNELNYATVFAKQIGEIVRNMSCAQDLTQKWRRDTGNAAAMREALNGILSALADAGFHPYVYGDPLAEAVLKARAALAAPPRNCDRFADEVDAQLAFLNEVWLISVTRETMLERDKFDNWTCEMRSEFAHWLLAPAEGKEASDGR